MSLMWPSVLQAVESSVEIMCESLEDVMKLPKIVIFNIFPPVNMSIAFLELSIENQKGGCIIPNQIISLNTIFHKWHLVSFRVPIVSLFHHIFHISSTVNSATSQAEVTKSWTIANLHWNQLGVCLSMGGQLRQKQSRWKKKSWTEV